MAWISLGDAAFLAVRSVAEAMEEESRRNRCGRQLPEWPKGSGLGGRFQSDIVLFSVVANENERETPLRAG